MAARTPIGPITARAFTIRTDAPEADGTFAWSQTTLVVVTVAGGGETGLGYTYSSDSVTGLITGKLAEVIAGQDVFDVPLCHVMRKSFVSAESVFPVRLIPN